MVCWSEVVAGCGAYEKSFGPESHPQAGLCEWFSVHSGRGTVSGSRAVAVNTPYLHGSPGARPCMDAQHIRMGQWTLSHLGDTEEVAEALESSLVEPGRRAFDLGFVSMSIPEFMEVRQDGRFSIVSGQETIACQQAFSITGPMSEGWDDALKAF